MKRSSKKFGKKASQRNENAKKEKRQNKNERAKQRRDETFTFYLAHERGFEIHAIPKSANSVIIRVFHTQLHDVIPLRRLR